MRSGGVRRGWLNRARPLEGRPVLLVDDDLGVIAVLEAGLEEAGFRVRSAQSVGGAREKLRRESFDLVVCDYAMPGETGLALLDFVSRLYPHLPFIMLTGRADSDLARRTIRSGAVDFLAKPCRIADLVRHMEQGWERIERDRGRIAAAAQEVLGGAIRALVAAIDAKDPHTATHSARVTAVALCLSDAAGLSAQERTLVEHSALLHDIGKIAIPDHILIKPGPLDEDEWAIVRAHPARSGEIVAQAPALAEVATIVRHHHERLDGRGYPDGVAGEAIPFLTRVITIADAYEAMTADRSYRPARTSREARGLLKAGWGSEFDPELGAVFDTIEDLP